MNILRRFAISGSTPRTQFVNVVYAIYDIPPRCRSGSAWGIYRAPYALQVANNHLQPKKKQGKLELRSFAIDARSRDLKGFPKMTFEYTTAGVEPALRFEYWNDVVCRHCIPAASRMLVDSPFDARLTGRSVGPVDITAMAAPLHHWSRDTHHLRMSDDDDLWIGYMSEGDGVVSQGGRRARLKNGEMALYDAAKPFDFTLTSRTIYLVRFPRRPLLQLCNFAERMTARTIDVRRPGVTPLKAMIEQAATIDFECLRPGAAERFGSSLIDLLAVALEFQVDEQEVPEERDLYARLEGYIRQNFEDPDLCLETLAKVHRVSTRTVTRTFSRKDLTPMGLVWKIRLETSKQALIDGRSKTVSEAALDHGFSDLSHFSYAFKKAFGCAPNTLIRTR